MLLLWNVPRGWKHLTAKTTCGEITNNLLKEPTSVFACCKQGLIVCWGGWGKAVAVSSPRIHTHTHTQGLMAGNRLVLIM